MDLHALEKELWCADRYEAWINPVHVHVLLLCSTD